MCEGCDKARKHPRSGLYIMGCDGCAARSIARTPAFFEAAREGRITPTYRQALHTLLPKVPPDVAHRMVKEWAK